MVASLVADDPEVSLWLSLLAVAVANGAESAVLAAKEVAVTSVALTVASSVACTAVASVAFIAATSVAFTVVASVEYTVVTSVAFTVATSVAFTVVASVAFTVVVLEMFTALDGVEEFVSCAETRPAIRTRQSVWNRPAPCCKKTKCLNLIIEVLPPPSSLTKAIL